MLHTSKSKKAIIACFTLTTLKSVEQLEAKLLHVIIALPRLNKATTALTKKLTLKSILEGKLTLIIT